MSMGYDEDDPRREQMKWEIKEGLRSMKPTARKNFDNSRFDMFKGRGKFKI